MMDPGIPKFMEIGPLGPHEKILTGFTIYGHGVHLGHVTNIIFKQFHFFLPKRLHTKFGKYCPMAPEKSKCYF